VQTGTVLDILISTTKSFDGISIKWSKPEQLVDPFSSIVANQQNTKVAVVYHYLARSLPAGKAIL